MSKRGRFWIFAFIEPEGGMNDFRFSFNNVEEFEERSVDMTKIYANYQLLDTKTHFHLEGDFGTITKWVCKNIGDEGYDDTSIF